MCAREVCERNEVFTDFGGTIAVWPQKKLKIKEIGSVQGWKDQQLVIEDIMKVELPGYKLRLEKTQKIEAI